MTDTPLEVKLISQSLHDQIMRLPCTPPYKSVTLLRGYRDGHRAARHAAAELAAAHEADAQQAAPVVVSKQPELWAVHAQGPDCLYAAKSREAAEKYASELNQLRADDGEIKYPKLNAIVIPSPWSELEHWKAIAEQEEQWCDDARRGWEACAKRLKDMQAAPVAVPVRYGAEAASTAVNPGAPLHGAHAAPILPAQQPVAWVLFHRDEVAYDRDEPIISNEPGDTLDDSYEWRRVYADPPAQQSQWVRNTPTEQARYWYWDGHEDSAPINVGVFLSPSGCFVHIGQLGITQAIDCKEWDGWWLLDETPLRPVDTAAPEQPDARDALRAERDELVGMVRAARLERDTRAQACLDALDERNTLRAEVEELRKSQGAEMFLTLTGEIAKLRAEVERLRKDAELFRRLRDLPDELLGAPGVPCVAVPEGPRVGRYVSGPDLDAALEASR